VNVVPGRPQRDPPIPQEVLAITRLYIEMQTEITGLIAQLADVTAQRDKYFRELIHMKTRMATVRDAVNSPSPAPIDQSAREMARKLAPVALEEALQDHD
jgi:hypothetical protein